MESKGLQSGLGNENFITGIFNYCDRWCERCTLTSRCMTFAVERRHRDGEEIDEVMNELFWNELGRCTESTQLNQSTEDFNIGFDFDIDDEDDDSMGGVFGGPDFIEEMEKQQIEKHPCIIGGSLYFELVHAWLQNAHHLAAMTDDQFMRRTEFGTQSAGSAPSATVIRDMVEVISYYHLSVFAKLRRAVHGKELDEMIDDEYPSDADGSAKVALMGIDRSSAAWMTLQRLVPEQETAAVRALLMLSKLRTVTERSFPTARLFVRPGFDDESA
ncbi:MAG: hypothetical protein M5R41_14565 [Bacteroidia bacterium]|nr:hypothetical protein [Bacteroidia bacterium]